MKMSLKLLGVAGTLVASTLAQVTTGPSMKNLKRMDHSGSYTYNISECVGYSLENRQETQTGLVADLKLLKNCSAFGIDIPELTLNVSYDTQQRLHVHIYDKPQQQWQVPDWLLPRPSDPVNSALKSTGDLSFNYTSSPFEWWITRRASNDIIFDTRNSSLPAPYTEVIPAEDLGQAGFVDNIDYPNNTAMPSWPFIFENQYIQVASSVPNDANIYGLGEAVASSGFRRNNTATVAVGWAADRGDNPDSNIYGSFPFYLEHRMTSNTTSASHGVFLTSSAGMDIVLREGVIEYRLVGGTLDLTFFSGPSPIEVIEQYGQVSGFSHLPPLFALGYNQCRWGYNNVSESRAVWQRLRDENIPVENMWNDIDWMQSYRNFVSDPQRFPQDELRAYVDELRANHQYWVPIIDAAINLELNSSDHYAPYRTGKDQDVFIKNPDGSEYIGQVWPGASSFADWFAWKTQQWWTDSFKAFSDIIPLTSVWLDMNEASSFCLGSCFSAPGADISNTSTPFFLPGPQSPITGYPEGYNSTISGTSGNITVNGTLTYKQSTPSLLKTIKGLARREMLKRSAGSGTSINYVGQSQLDVQDITFPPYMLHNAQDEMNLGTHALAPNATHANGAVELDVHNLWGFMEEKATHSAFTTTVNPGKRPFMISRSLFAGASKYTGAWTGDNSATWLEAERSIQGVLNFAMFQVALAGADACGFNGNTGEELCNRWMQLAAFTPFYRNHNVLAAIPQEPYVWDSVANATRIATAARYQLLPYWYTLFAGAHFSGTPVVRALFMEFPNDASLLSVSKQFLVGSSILVTPVLTPNVSTVTGLFPDPVNTVWRNWFTHEVIDTSSKSTAGSIAAANVTLSAPLSTIPISIRGGSILLLYAEPKYTTFETAATGYSLLAALSKNGTATGTGYQDDGETFPVQTDGDWYTFNATTTSLVGSHKSGSGVNRPLKKATILGVTSKPSNVSFNGLGVGNYTYKSNIQELVVNLPTIAEIGKGFNISWT